MKFRERLALWLAQQVEVSVPPWAPMSSATSAQSSGLTPEGLVAIFTEGNAGDMTRVQSLYREMIEKDGTLASVVQARKLALAAMPMEFVAAREGDDSVVTRQQILALQQMRDQMSSAYVWTGSSEFLTWDDLVLALLDAPPKGFSVVELRWSQSDDYFWTVDGARFMDQTYFTFHGSDYMRPNEIRIRTEKNMAPGELLPPRRYIVHYNRITTGYPARFGFMRAAAYLYVLKSMALKSLAAYSEKFGQPPLVFNYDGTDKVSAQQAREAAMRFGEDFVAALPNTVSAKLLDIPTSTTLPQERMNDLVNAEYAKLVLGQTATTEQTPGKLGNSSEQAELRYDIMEADAKSLQSTLNAQLVRPFLEMNWGEVRAMLKIRYEREEDRAERAKVVETVARMAPVPLAFIEKELGVPQPVDNEPATAIHKKDVSLF